MSDMIHKFKEVFPKAQVSMYEAQPLSFCRPCATGAAGLCYRYAQYEMQLQDSHVEPLFESEFVLVASKVPTCTGKFITLESLKDEQRVPRKRIWATTAELLYHSTTKWHQSIENIVKQIPLSQYIILFSMPISNCYSPRDMTTRLLALTINFITIPIKHTLPVARWRGAA